MGKIGLAILGLLLVLASQAQTPVADSSRRLEILHADRYNFEKIDSVTSMLSLAGKVKLLQQGTLFFADSAVLNQYTNVLEAFGNIHINDGDSIHTYSKYLRYKSNEKQAYLKTNVKLVDNKGSVLTTNELNYDMNLGIADYLNNGKVLNKKTVLTSKNARYYEATKDVIFSKQVVLIDPDYTMRTDSLQYNSRTEVVTFIAPTTIVSGKRKILTKSGYYNLQTGKAVFAKRSTIIDSTFSIVSDDMAFDDKDGLGQFNGNVVYIDTASGVSIFSDELFANKKQSSFLATKFPILILKQDKDSVFITADTLFSGKLTSIAHREIPFILDTTGKGYTMPDLKGKDSSMNRFFEAWHHVRIFSDSVQAVCDSMFYAGTDSTFRLFQQPFVWSSESQITADTMYLFTKNKKPHKLEAFFNGFIINKVANSAYNQVRGNTVNAWFVNGGIDYVRAKGRAESVYYVLDDQDRFVGMNRSSADAIDMFFVEKKANKVKFINDLKGTTYPVSQIPTGENQLKGFDWQDAKRPKNKESLFGR
ncbi:MAG TPA: OstA-like protein [Phnomibacter sp.]|nr:OstA-like protein [Phnomibacter sp.]